MGNIGVSKDAEIIDLGERVTQDYSHLKSAKNRARAGKSNEKKEKAFTDKKIKTSNSNSYATEGILKDNWVKDRANTDPGFTPGKVHSFSMGSCWDENGRLKRKGE